MLLHRILLQDNGMSFVACSLVAMRVMPWCACSTHNEAAQGASAGRSYYSLARAHKCTEENGRLLRERRYEADNNDNRTRITVDHGRSD